MELSTVPSSKIQIEACVNIKYKNNCKIYICRYFSLNYFVNYFPHSWYQPLPYTTPTVDNRYCDYDSESFAKSIKRNSCNLDSSEWNQYPNFGFHEAI